MAYFDEQHPAAQPIWRGALRRIFETPFDRRARALRRKVEALRMLSDDQLAARGLSRQDIVVHVFAQKA